MATKKKSSGDKLYAEEFSNLTDTLASNAEKVEAIHGMVKELATVKITKEQELNIPITADEAKVAIADQKKDLNSILEALKELTKALVELTAENKKWYRAGKFN